MGSSFLFILFALLSVGTAVSAEKSECELNFSKFEATFRSHANALRELGYSQDAAERITELRPDVALAILKVRRGEKNPYLTFAPDVIPNGFLREDLKPYFSEELWKPVRLFRGVDQAQINPELKGEKLLIWTSEHVSDTVPYALANPDSKESLILEFQVPRFLVRERSGWPVLRLEDAPDIRPFLEKVGVIRISQPIRRTIERSPGDEDAYRSAIEKQSRGFLDGAGNNWKSGYAKDRYISLD